MESQANTPIRSFPSSNSPLPTSSISANLRERTRKLSKAFSSVSTTSLNLADFGRMGRSRDNLQNVENDLRSSHLSSFRGYSDDIRPSSSSIISQDGVSGAKRRKSEKEDCVISWVCICNLYFNKLYIVWTLQNVFYHMTVFHVSFSFFCISTCDKLSPCSHGLWKRLRT